MSILCLSARLARALSRSTSRRACMQSEAHYVTGHSSISRTHKRQLCRGGRLRGKLKPATMLCIICRAGTWETKGGG